MINQLNQNLMINMNNKNIKLNLIEIYQHNLHHNNNK